MKWVPLPLSSDLFRIVFGATSDYVYVYDRKGYYVYANPRGVQALGLSLEAVVGRFWHALRMPVGMVASFEDDFQAVLDRGEPIIRQTLPSGGEDGRYYECLLAPLKDEADIVQMIVASVRDITVRKTAEARAWEGEQRFRNLCEAAPDGIVLVDQRGIISLVNKQIERIFGYRREQLIGEQIERLVPERYRAQHVRHRNIYQQSSVTREMGIGMELYGLRADGSEFPVEVALSPFKSESGTETVAIVRDITVRKRAERQLQESEALLHSIIDNTPALIFLKDLQGRYLMLNRQCAKLFQSKPEEVIGKTDYDFFPKEVADQFHYNDRRVAEAGHALEIDEQLPQEDGIHTYLCVKFPLLDTTNAIYGIGGVATDITERKWAEEQIRELNRSLQDKVAELDAANRELESFSYSVSHDLRAPLRTMQGFSEILEEEYAEALDESGKHYLRRIQLASQRMGLLIDGLLRLARISRVDLDRSWLDLSAMAAELAEELYQEQPEHPVEISIQPGMLAQVDEKLFRIALKNLLANAWKYTRDRDRPQVEFTCFEKKKGKLVFVLRDNGVGFNQNYVSKLFQVFQRLHSSYDFEGLGVGLAIVQRVIHRHGGEIWAEGAEGQGAAFFFTVETGGGKEDKLNSPPYYSNELQGLE